MSEREPPTAMLTVVEAAGELRMSEAHTKRLIRRGTLPSVLVGRARRVRRRDLDAYVERLKPDIVSKCSSCARSAS